MIRRWPLNVFSLEIRKLFSYRMDFWIHFLGSLLAQFGVAWFLWRAIFTFQNVQQVGPYTFHAMMLYYVLAPLVARCVHGADFGGLAQEIYDGTLNRYLIYPVSFFKFRLASSAAQCTVFTVQLLVSVVVFALVAGIPAEFRITPLSMAAGLAAIIAAGYLHFVIVSTIELTAFWADNVWSIVVIIRFLMGLLGGGMLPLALFPQWAQPMLYSMPFAYFISFPVDVICGRISPERWAQGMGVILLWSMAMTIAYRLVWNRGRYAYTGVGI